MVGITIGDKHTFKDWGLRLLSFSVSLPKKQKKLIQVPGRNGLVDVSLPEKREAYESREIKFVCDSLDKNFAEWSNLVSDIANYVQDERLKIIPDFDNDYYYEGWVTIEPSKNYTVSSKIIFIIKVDPYKMKNALTVVNFSVAGSKTVVLTNEKRKTTLRMITDAEVTVSKDVTFKKTFSIGDYVSIGIILDKGETQLTFEGTANVMLEYREGKL